MWFRDSPMSARVLFCWQTGNTLRCHDANFDALLPTEARTTGDKMRTRASLSSTPSSASFSHTAVTTWEWLRFTFFALRCMGETRNAQARTSTSIPGTCPQGKSPQTNDIKWDKNATECFCRWRAVTTAPSKCGRSTLTTSSVIFASASLSFYCWTLLQFW